MPTQPPAEPTADPGLEKASDGHLSDSEEGLRTTVRLTKGTHARLLALGDSLGSKSHDATLALLLDLYDLNSGTFAPTDIMDLAVTQQQLNLGVAALNATLMQLVEIIRDEHRGAHAKCQALADDMSRELARLRAAKFPAA